MEAMNSARLLRVVVVGQDAKLLKSFVQLPRTLYASDPCFVSPLDLERKMAFDRNKNPFFAHADMELFLCYRGSECVGRISAQIDREHLRIHNDNAGFFGNFECVDDAGVAQALFGAAEAWLLERGMSVMRGPYATNINDESGLEVEGFSDLPMFLTAHHLPYYRALVEDAGFAKVKELYSWIYDGNTVQIPEIAQKIAARARNGGRIKIRSIDMKHFESELRTGLEIFNEAWSDNWGFVPLTEAEIRKAAEDLKLIIDPRIILIAEYDGVPVAMALMIPNINEALQPVRGRLFPFGWAKLLWRTKVKRPTNCRLTLLGIKPEFRGLRTGGGLSVLLYVEIFERAMAAGYRRAELSWTLEDNTAINHGIEMMGGKIYKRHYVYERPIAQAATR